MRFRKECIGCILIFLILINFVSSATNQVVVTSMDSQTAKKGGWFDTWVGWWLFSPIFWGAMIFILVFFALLFGLLFFIKWFIKYLKNRNDIFYNLRSERIKLSKIQKTYPSKHWLKTSKNAPIRLIKNVGGKAFISSPIAHHRGDFTTHEGNVIIAMNLVGNKKFFFFPKTDLLVVPNIDKKIIKKKNAKGEVEDIIIDHIPRADDIVQFNSNEILLHAESLSNIGLFFVPVLRTKDNKIVDLSMPVYQSLREVALGEFLYSQTDEFVKVARKSINMSPSLNYQVKTNDSSGNVEVPQGAGGST